MRILILSDSHGKLDNMYTVLEKLASGLDMVIHLGDNTSDADRFKNTYKGVEFHIVSGNCDYSGKYGQEAIIRAAGRRIFFTHGHKQNVKLNPQRLVYTASEKEVDICLYGHTHIPTIFDSESIIFMNPGSISLPRDDNMPSYGMISFESSGSYISVVTIKKSGFELKYSMPL